MSDDVYGGTWRLADKVWRRYGIETDPIDLRDLDAVAAAFATDRPPRMVWIETPTNPLMKVVDISAVARLAAVAGALTVVDNTFATPYIQRPVNLGATSCSTRRRVPRRPLGRDGAAWSPPAPTSSPSGFASTRTPPARCRARSTASRAARTPDAGGAHGARIGQRAGPGAVARRAPRGRVRELSRPAGPPRCRARRAPDARPRRDAELRAARR